jgi:2'-5' RNA ligase
MRLFVAVWPPPAVVHQLRAIDRPPLPGVRWTTEQQWHVTLRFLGDVADDEIEGVKGGLAQLDRLGTLPALTAVAGPVVSRLGESVLCVPVSGLEPLAVSVEQLTAAVGESPGRRPFRGHLTLARTRPGMRPPATGTPLAASWPVDEVTLVASTLHPAGARYQVIGRIALHRGENGSVLDAAR